VQALIDELAAEGLAVLLVSSDMEELIDGADRLVVLRDGVAVGELAGDQVTEDKRAGGDRVRRRGEPVMADVTVTARLTVDRSRCGLVAGLRRLRRRWRAAGVQRAFTANFLSVANFRTQLVEARAGLRRRARAWRW